MSVIYALIPVAILFVIIAVVIFFWAVKSNQFEDIERQGMSILLDDEEDQQQQQQKHSSETQKKNQNEQ